MKAQLLILLCVAWALSSCTPTESALTGRWAIDHKAAQWYYDGERRAELPQNWYERTRDTTLKFSGNVLEVQNPNTSLGFDVIERGDIYWKVISYDPQFEGTRYDIWVVTEEDIEITFENDGQMEKYFYQKVQWSR